MGMKLDFEWIQNAVADTKSGASNVIVVETNDPMREEQLMLFALGNYRGGVYAFHPWTGLTVANQGAPQFAPVSLSADTAGYNNEMRNDLKDLGGALQEMDRILRNQNQIAFLITGQEQAGGAHYLSNNTLLVNALRAWSHDRGITARKALICLVTAHPASTVDTITLERTVLARPDLSNDEERLEIVKHLAGMNTRVRLNENAVLMLSRATRGLSLHQTKTVLMRTVEAGQPFSPDLVKHYKSEYIRRSETVEIEEPEVGFADVGGYEGIKKMVLDTFVASLQKPQRAQRAAIDLPRGILLYGPPGTGKTLFAKSLARETNLPFINLKTENLFASLLGETGQRLRDAIRIAEQASPALVFIDEIDRFGSRAHGGSDGASQETNRAFGQMLEWLGDAKRKSIIIGTTNRPGDLDDAIIRSGRFSYIAPFLYPNAKAREQILRIHLGLEGGRPKPVMNEPAVLAAIPKIAQETDLYAGADLEEMVKRAKLAFFRSTDDIMTEMHLLAGHRDFRISTEKRKGLLATYRDLGPEFANSLEMLESYEKGD